MVNRVVLMNGVGPEDVPVLALDNGDGTFSLAETPFQLSSFLNVTAFEATTVVALAIAVNAHLTASLKRLINIEFWGTVGMKHFCAVTEAT